MFAVTWLENWILTYLGLTQNKTTLRHPRFNQNLQVSCHLVNSLNHYILNNPKLKHNLLTLILCACWKHTQWPGAMEMLLFPWGSPSQVGDAAGPCQSVAPLWGAGPAVHPSTGMSCMRGCSAEPHASVPEMLPCSCVYGQHGRELAEQEDGALLTQP